MEIPPEARDSASEFVDQYHRLAAVERVQKRQDAATTALLVLIIVVNVAAAATDLWTVLSALVCGVAGVVLGFHLFKAQQRRASFRAVSEAATEVETALAFHELDESL
jgi:hypothetical protein